MNLKSQEIIFLTFAISDVLQEIKYPPTGSGVWVWQCNHSLLALFLCHRWGLGSEGISCPPHCRWPRFYRMNPHTPPVLLSAQPPPWQVPFSLPPPAHLSQPWPISSSPLPLPFLPPSASTSAGWLLSVPSLPSHQQGGPKNVWLMKFWTFSGRHCQNIEFPINPTWTMGGNQIIFEKPKQERGDPRTLA